MWIIIFAALLVIVLGFFISVSNKLNRQQIKIQEASSGIDVALTKRFDTLTKLLDVVRSHTQYEQNIILETVRLRQGMSLPEQQQADAALQQAAQQIRLMAEAYPNLNSSQSFVQLSHGAMDAEEHLQAARRLYNANVSSYNQMVVTFPDSIVAGMKGCTQQPMYVANDMQRQDVSLRV